MSDLTQMTQTALKSASKGASKATSKDGALSDPKTLAVAGVGLAALPLAVEQIAKRVAPKVSDLGEQAKDKVSDVASGAACVLDEPALAGGDLDGLGPDVLGVVAPGEPDDVGGRAPGGEEEGGDGRGEAGHSRYPS